MVLNSLFTSTPSLHRNRRCSCSGTLRAETTPSPHSTGWVLASPEEDSIGNSLAFALLLDRRSFTIRLTTSGRRSGFARWGEREDGASACDMRGEDGGELKDIMADNYTEGSCTIEKGGKESKYGRQGGVACTSYGRDQTIFGKGCISTIFSAFSAGS